jgi:hypothetical protein
MPKVAIIVFILAWYAFLLVTDSDVESISGAVVW